MNPGKIRRMARIEQFTSGEAQEYLKIARYYRSDYIGLHLIRNFFLVTIGYVLLIALYLLRNGVELLDTIYTRNLPGMAVGWIAGYVILLSVYTVLTYTVCSLRFAKAKKMERYLDHQLEKMQQKYEPDEVDGK